MDTHTLSSHGSIDVQEVVVSEVLRSEGAFEENDVLKRIADRIQPYMDMFSPEEKIKTLQKIRSFLDYTIRILSAQNTLRYVSKGKYRVVNY